MNETRECWDCVFSIDKDGNASNIVCKVDHCFPYRTQVDGRRICHPAVDCEYFIRRTPMNSRLEFIVKSRPWHDEEPHD